LNAIEEAKGLSASHRRLQLTQLQVADAGEGPNDGDESPRVLSLPEEVQQMVEKGAVEHGHAGLCWRLGREQSTLGMAERGGRRRTQCS